MHRLIPSRYSDQGTVLAEVADNPTMLDDIMLLDGATNDRIQGEQYGLSGMSTFELVYGVQNSQIVRAAFLHTGQFGSRFNDPTRGAWYAAVELATSISEVTYHKARRLAEIVVPELPGKRPDEDITTYDDWQADFHAAFHVLDPAEQYADCLQPEPIPECYKTSQTLARQLLDQKSNGLVYPSVRQAGATCLVCFRPALVYNPRRSKRYQIRLKATKKGYERRVLSVTV